MMFGLQYIMKRYLAGQVIDFPKILQAQRFFKKHFGNESIFNLDGAMHILNDHGGRLPIAIYAAPEGMMIPEGNVMFTIENTCPQCAWITNYLETKLVQAWYPCTTGTISREMKKIIRAALVRSGDERDENLAFKLHDFGYRGVSSSESAALGGAAHLVNFMGTDTLAACELLMEYYGTDMPGFSIPAAEHSTITSWGKDHEVDAYRHILKEFPTGMVAVVSDSWDIRNAIKIWGTELQNQIMSRDGVLVIRPDSGDPITLLPELLNLIQRIFQQFTSIRTNSKGYKMLPNQVRMIQGDGIKRSTLAPILDAIMDAGWSADNIAFGSGGGLLQDCNRDTQRMALKCSYVEIDGNGRNVFKQPATDSTKNSKSGRLMLARTTHKGLATLPYGNPGYTDILTNVFLNGEVLVDHTLEDIRKRARL
jgi:nicotinamide phosphoribosyltransferase